MNRFTIQDALVATGAHLWRGDARRAATGVSTDTRSLRDGDLFFALSGPNFDGLAEMQAAIPLPVIASGGVCTLDHVRRLMAGGIPGCIIGRALYEGSLDLAAALDLTRDTLPDRRLL